MKYQIFDYEEEPIYWNDEILEFDTREAADAFAAGLRELYWINPFDKFYVAEAIPHCAKVKNATGLVPVANGDDVELKEVS